MRLEALHVLVPAAFGGLERVVTLLTTTMARHGHRIGVAPLVAPGAQPPAFVEELRDNGVEVHTLTPQRRSYLAERRLLETLMRTLKPAIVHTHGYRPDVLFRGVIQSAGSAAVSTAHGFTAGTLKNRFYEALNRRAYRRFDAVVAVSQPLGRRIAAAGVDSRRIHVIPNAWAPSPRLSRADARAELRISNEAFVVGWVGRLSLEKGPDIAIDALAHMTPPRPQLLVIGSGPLERSLREQADRLGVAQNVVFAGARKDAASLFEAFDVFLLSSRTEGTPMVLFEAMGSGVPAAVTAVGGVPDVVTPADAEIVPTSPEALARAVDRLVRDPAHRAALASAARRRVAERYAVDPWADAYAALYARLSAGFGQ